MLIKEKCSVVCYFTGNFSYTIGSWRFTHIFHCLPGPFANPSYNELFALVKI